MLSSSDILERPPHKTRLVVSGLLTHRPPEQWHPMNTNSDELVAYCEHHGPRPLRSSSSSGPILVLTLTLALPLILASTSSATSLGVLLCSTLFRPDRVLRPTADTSPTRASSPGWSSRLLLSFFFFFSTNLGVLATEIWYHPTFSPTTAPKSYQCSTLILLPSPSRHLQSSPFCQPTVTLFNATLGNDDSNTLYAISSDK